ncbi:MAG: hypothetical protein ABEH83_11540 [Halobacterium sp.]
MTGRRRLRRRDFLAAAGTVGITGATGCLGFLETKSVRREPPLPDDRPDAVYFPSHVEGMQMVGTQASGRYRCALSYTFPHRFWLVRDTAVDRVKVRGADDVHLMVSVWDAELGVVLPAASPQVEYTGPEGETESFAPWQMLSQQMGVHNGDNVTLGPEGTYDVSVRVAPPSTRRSERGDVSTEPVTFDFQLTYDRSALESLSYRDVPSDREGTEGAVDPMGMDAVSVSRVPAADDLSMPVRGSAQTGGAELVAVVADQAGSLATGDDETYLALSLRTPYNRFVLPSASAFAAVGAGGETVFDGALTPTLDADLGYHYGAVVPTGDPLDELTVGVDTPPQVSRHEGYETAFFDFDPVTF